MGLLIIFRNMDNRYRIEHQTLAGKIHLYIQGLNFTKHRSPQILII